mmetsp:Transcript_116285/g.340202  ORF Transcript_116285/g.340202 Transcript_116285/m.340202 type:complete len:218 (+) Transcript_116285:94-747(+)
MPVWMNMPRKKPIRDVVAPVKRMDEWPGPPRPSRFMAQEDDDDEVDCVVIEGREPVPAVSADWNEALARKDTEDLCQMAPVLFDVVNADGGDEWGDDAKGAIVVALRDEVEFEDMARFAEDSGAVGLIVVDNEEVFEDDWEMTWDRPDKAAPKIPAVLVPKPVGDHLCSGQPDLRAKIIRRGGRRAEHVADAEELMKQFVRLRTTAKRSRSASPANS